MSTRRVSDLLEDHLSPQSALEGAFPIWEPSVANAQFEFNPPFPPTYANAQHITRSGWAFRVYIPDGQVGIRVLLQDVIGFDKGKARLNTVSQHSQSLPGQVEKWDALVAMRLRDLAHVTKCLLGSPQHSSIVASVTALYRDVPVSNGQHSLLLHQKPNGN
jgi:hypothetical protein